MTPARPTLVTLAQLVHATSLRGHEPEVERAGRRCIVDWLGVALAGLDEPAARALARTAGVERANARALLAAILDGAATPEDGARILGTAGHALDFDDTDHVNLIHVSATLLPALVLAARAHPLSGTSLLRIVIAAHEAEDRLGALLGRRLTAAGWHVSGIIGHPGAALAAALALGLPTERVAHAAAIAATAASGFIGAFGSMCKPLQIGRAAADGLAAARLAAEGFTGPLAFLDAVPGFARPLVGEAIDDWSSVERDWGRPFAILRNSFKPHASCMITHPTIDAASRLHARLAALDHPADGIARVECVVNPLAPQVAGIASPATGLEGKFSVRYCCALALLDGHCMPAGFSAARLARDDIRALVDKVAVRADAAVGEQQARVTVHLADGAALEEVVVKARGHPSNPLGDDDLDAKFLHLATPVLGHRAGGLLADCHRLDRIPDVAAWLRGHL